MDVQWYPGHMAKAKRKIQEDLKLIDVVIELLDARVPTSSKNPMVDSLIGQKPKIVLLNKSDLADPEVNQMWSRYYNSIGQKNIFADSITGKGLDRLVREVERSMSEVTMRDRQRGRINRQIKCMIVGIPNVGKSTLINKMAGKSSAKTGNIPGVTKSNQWIRVSNKILLLDTPGILWPKFDDYETGLKLAWIGSIKDTIYDREEASLKLIGFLKERYPENLMDRYGIDIQLGEENLAVFEKIATKRGLIQRGGIVDYARTADMLLDEVRKIKIGRISFDTPPVVDGKEK